MNCNKCYHQHCICPKPYYKVHYKRHDKCHKKPNNKCTGPTGPKGSEGQRGPRGYDGLRGQQGQKGQTGHEGTRGPRGYNGIKGPTGPEGPTGPYCYITRPGPTGPRGPRGLTGHRGVQGMKGNQGNKGMKGEKGDRGHRGNIGEEGPTGPEGEIGERGCTGCPGPTGQKGLMGDMGIQGPSGIKGPKGERGPTGLIGPKGCQGCKGNEGCPGPRGHRGVPGRRGVQGPAGHTGDKGQKGCKGYTGPTGHKGNRGDTGYVGPRGHTGGIGPTGPAGKSNSIKCVIIYKYGIVTSGSYQKSEIISYFGQYCLTRDDSTLFSYNQSDRWEIVPNQPTGAYYYYDKISCQIYLARPGEKAILLECPIGDLIFDPCNKVFYFNTSEGWKDKCHINNCLPGPTGCTGSHNNYNCGRNLFAYNTLSQEETHGSTGVFEFSVKFDTRSKNNGWGISGMNTSFETPINGSYNLTYNINIYVSGSLVIKTLFLVNGLIEPGSSSIRSYDTNTLNNYDHHSKTIIKDLKIGDLVSVRVTAGELVSMDSITVETDSSLAIQKIF